MSRKRMFIMVAAICVVAVIGIFLALRNKTDISGKTAAPAEALSVQLEKACQIFTDNLAKDLLGGQAVKGDGSNATSSSDDVAVSECAYIDRSQASAASGERTRASLVVRTARSSAGSQANKSVFSAPPEGAKSISGYGDAAFWNEQFGQLNILKDDTWYVLEYGSLVPSERKEADARKFAELLAGNL